MTATAHANLAARMGRWSASHRKIAIFGERAFVISACHRRERGPASRSLRLIRSPPIASCAITAPLRRRSRTRPSGGRFVRHNLILQAYIPFAPLIAHGALQAPIGDATVSVVDVGISPRSQQPH